MALQIDMNTVAICMATYNGEKYLSKQLESILDQSYSNWVLFIRDDGSADNSHSIILRYTTIYPNKIILIEDSSLSGGGASNNFMSILWWVTKHYDFNYYMFCDQDDFWLNTKIEHSMNRIKNVESRYNGPVLIHTDLFVADNNLNIIDDSFISYRDLDPFEIKINRLIVQNNVTGCTMLWNKKLNEQIQLFDTRIVMHDWWIAITASLLGQISFIDEPTILYRQHGDNVIGATKVKSISFVFKRLFGHNQVRETLVKSTKQASLVLERFNDLLSNKDKKAIVDFSNLYEYKKCQRIIIVLKHSLLKQGPIQIIGELLFI